MAHDLLHGLTTRLECEEGIYMYISVETFQIFYTY